MEIEQPPNLSTEEIAVVASALTKHRRKRRRWSWLRNLFRHRKMQYKYHVELPPSPPERVLTDSGILTIKSKLNERRAQDRLPNTEKIYLKEIAHISR